MTAIHHDLHRSRSVDAVYITTKRPRSRDRLEYVFARAPRRMPSVEDLKREIDVAEADLWLRPSWKSMARDTALDRRYDLPLIVPHHIERISRRPWRLDPPRRSYKMPLSFYRDSSWWWMRSPLLSPPSYAIQRKILDTWPDMYPRYWRNEIDPAYRRPLWFGVRPWVYETDEVARATGMYERGHISLEQLEKYWILPAYSEHFETSDRPLSAAKQMADRGLEEYLGATAASLYRNLRRSPSLAYKRRYWRALLDEEDDRKQQLRRYDMLDRAVELHRSSVWPYTPLSDLSGSWSSRRSLSTEPGVMRSYTSPYVARYGTNVFITPPMYPAPKRIHHTARNTYLNSDPTHYGRFVDMDYSNPLWYGRRIWSRPTSETDRAIMMYRRGEISRDLLYKHWQRPIFHSLYGNYSSPYSPFWAYGYN